MRGPIPHLHNNSTKIERESTQQNARFRKKKTGSPQESQGPVLCHVGLAILNVGGVAGDRKSLVQETLERLCFLDRHVHRRSTGRVLLTHSRKGRDGEAVATRALGGVVAVDFESEAACVLVVAIRAHKIFSPKLFEIAHSPSVLYSIIAAPSVHDFVGKKFTSAPAKLNLSSVSVEFAASWISTFFYFFLPSYSFSFTSTFFLLDELFCVHLQKPYKPL